MQERYEDQHTFRPRELSNKMNTKSMQLFRFSTTNSACLCRGQTFCSFGIHSIHRTCIRHVAALRQLYRPVAHHHIFRLTVTYDPTRLPDSMSPKKKKKKKEKIFFEFYLPIFTSFKFSKKKEKEKHKENAHLPAHTPCDKQ